MITFEQNDDGSYKYAALTNQEWGSFDLDAKLGDIVYLVTIVASGRYGSETQEVGVWKSPQEARVQVEKIYDDEDKGVKANLGILDATLEGCDYHPLCVMDNLCS